MGKIGNGVWKPVLAVAVGLLAGLLLAEMAVRLLQWTHWIPPPPGHTWIHNERGRNDCWLVGFGPSRVTQFQRTSFSVTSKPASTSAARQGLGCVTLYTENPRGTFLDVRKHPEFAPQFRSEIDRAIEKGHIYAVGYQLNANGFRNADFTPPSPGRKRIAFLGDSFTYGEGVWEQDTYPRVFEALLKASGDKETEVLNLGMLGFRVEDVSKTLEGTALPLGATEIYYSYVLHHPIRSPAFQKSCPEPRNLDEVKRKLADLESDADSGPLALVALLRQTIQRRQVTARTIEWYQRMYSSENDEGLQTTLKIIRNMRQLSESRGVKMRLVIFPLFYSLEGGYPFHNAHDIIAKFCAREGIPCLDLYDFYKGRRTYSLVLTSFNSHPNEVAQRIAAEAIFKWRQEMKE